MMKRIAAAATVVAFTAGGLLIGPGVASAHHPVIEGEIVCADEGNVPMINYTATAWTSFAGDQTNTLSRQNDQVDVSVDGDVVGSGAFNSPNYSFSGSTPLPAGAQTGDVIVLTATAVADWGNGTDGGSSRSVELVVPELDCDPDLTNGRFTGGGHQIRVDGVRVTRGLTIHCDLVLSNNLEINWNGNQFHMLEHLTTVECSDSPDIVQAPPPAPLDTLIGTGSGRYNGNEGYSIEFTLQDYGEPGRNDQMAILITEDATGAVILDVPLQTLSGGNLQAHYDQPHK
jgi:hypothetical protein